ncbi:unnamed protein product [Caenorhabditis auriculariae]|uniref:Tyrosine specific protein phosphatases domain-containing protein n=1 Tax=Caenorhabditis auriculariae TaxID=2777116 RepID=A0A8S1HSN4_9PELO|nr:unnamed protein product [Caenorhabditis auriculariae]
MNALYLIKFARRFYRSPGNVVIFTKFVPNWDRSPVGRRDATRRNDRKAVSMFLRSLPCCDRNPDLPDLVCTVGGIFPWFFGMRSTLTWLIVPICVVVLGIYAFISRRHKYLYPFLIITVVQQFVFFETMRLIIGRSLDMAEPPSKSLTLVVVAGTVSACILLSFIHVWQAIVIYSCLEYYEDRYRTLEEGVFETSRVEATCDDSNRSRSRPGNVSARSSSRDRNLTNKINSVVNLQEFGEHSFCGTGVGTSGFSYDPELLMRNGIYYYNFPMPDFHSCSAPRLLDIVKVVTYALTTGKVAIHCHAGHGRTGMVIAAVLMYRKGISPMEAVALLLINNDGGCIIPPRKFLHISQYVQYNSRFISRSEARLYGNIPKVVYIAMKTLLLKFYESVSIDLRHENERCNFHCERGKLIENLKILLDPSEIEASLNREHLETTKSWYQDATEKGLSICCMEVYFEDMAGFREIIRFVDYFFHATFHQITYRDDLLAALEDGKSSGFNPNRGKNNRDWIFTFFFLLKCVAALPEQLHFAMARLISK